MNRIGAGCECDVVQEICSRLFHELFKRSDPFFCTGYFSCCNVAHDLLNCDIPKSLWPLWMMWMIAQKN